MNNLLTVREVMGKLKISRTTLWSLTNEGKIESVKIGGSVRYQPEEIERFIQNSKTETSEVKKEPTKVANP